MDLTAEAARSAIRTVACRSSRCVLGRDEIGAIRHPLLCITALLPAARDGGVSPKLCQNATITRPFHDCAIMVNCMGPTISPRSVAVGIPGRIRGLCDDARARVRQTVWRMGHCPPAINV